jgi:type IV secretory pathway TrbL component
LANVSIQVYLTAMVMNLKRLSAFLLLFFVCWKSKCHYRSVLYLPTFSRIMKQRQKICLSRVIAA